MTPVSIFLAADEVAGNILCDPDGSGDSGQTLFATVTPGGAPSAAVFAGYG